MTRDEAEKKLLEAESRHLSFDHASVAYLIDALEALGLIKFDTPKLPYDKFQDALIAARSRGPFYPHEVMSILEETGLELVDPSAALK